MYQLDRKLTAANYSNEEYGEAMEWHEVRVHRQWVEEDLPRLVINPFIVGLWSFYELVIVELARLVQKKQSKPLSLSDIKGSHILDRADKYFGQVLHFPIDLNDSRRETLNRVGAIRNAIAHSNGRMSGLSSKYQKSIRELEIKGVGSNGPGNYIVLDLSYAEEIFAVVQEHVKLLFARYETL